MIVPYKPSSQEENRMFEFGDRVKVFVSRPQHGDEFVHKGVVLRANPVPLLAWKNEHGDIIIGSVGDYGVSGICPDEEAMYHRNCNHGRRRFPSE